MYSSHAPATNSNELREMGVDQFSVYLQHDAKDETLRAYGEKVIPAIAEEIRAKG